MAAPDLSILSPGVILPPVVETATEPVFPFVGAGTRIEAEPALGVARPQTRPHVHSDSRERTLDMVAEIGLNCARLAQRNGLMGCGLAEYDLTLRHLRQQLRRLETAAEAAIQDPARPGGANKVPDLLGSDRNAPLRQGLQDLAATLAQMVGLRDQLGEYQRESAELLAHQTQLADDLQDGLLNRSTVEEG
jgi:chemosensory pili system protein ChpA (sensor histidine kinase/response regulator)